MTGPGDGFVHGREAPRALAREAQDQGDVHAGGMACGGVLLKSSSRAPLKGFGVDIRQV